MANDEFDRAEILRRIKALLNKTVENGCTEEEAATATAKIGELIDKHGFKVADFDAKSEKADFKKIIDLDEIKFDDKLRMTKGVWGAIAHYTDTKHWYLEKALIFFGREMDVDFAKYLVHLFKSAMYWEWKKYRVATACQSLGKTARHEFYQGMAASLSVRLMAMKATRNAVHSADGRTGKDLVVNRLALVNEAFDKLNMTLKMKSYKPPTISEHSQAGNVAGNKVPINLGVRQDQIKKIE